MILRRHRWLLLLCGLVVLLAGQLISAFVRPVRVQASAAIAGSRSPKPAHPVVEKSPNLSALAAPRPAPTAAPPRRSHSYYKRDENGGKRYGKGHGKKKGHKKGKNKRKG